MLSYEPEALSGYVESHAGRLSGFQHARANLRVDSVRCRYEQRVTSLVLAPGPLG